MRHAADFVSEIAASGRYTFTTDQAARSLGASTVAVRAALRRLKAKGEIADPHRGFHVAVPPEYRRLGCLPAEQFIGQLMEHLREPYYVALLSAAELHGAAHQRPQALQVIVRTNRRAIVCGQVRVQFVARKDMEKTPIVEKNTPRGRLRVASPEATALELVGYAEKAGGLDNVAAILTELVESMAAEKLVAAARLSPIAWAQRLGYLLDVTAHPDLAEALLPHVREHAHFIAPLVRAKSKTGAERAERWRLAVNAAVEADT
jgi:predicted transcriptional regulator of viral defense system